MIETKRLLIRPFQSGDINHSLEWFFDIDIMKWIPNGPDRNKNDLKKRISFYIDHFKRMQGNGL